MRRQASAIPRTPTRKALPATKKAPRFTCDGKGVARFFQISPGVQCLIHSTKYLSILGHRRAAFVGLARRPAVVPVPFTSSNASH
jgi:hypothetical protein